MDRENVENPIGCALAIIRKILNLSQIDYIFQRKRRLTEEEMSAAEVMVTLRLRGEPLQYILGDIEFYGRTIKTDRRALIPRPETEILVEWAVGIARWIAQPRVLDIGAGSGAIAIAMAACTDCRVTAVDNSEKALELAYENSALNHVDNKIDFIQADVNDGSFRDKVGGGFDFVLSNPPYVSLKEMPELPVEVREYEPAAALYGGEDGLDYYRRLAGLIPELCCEGGWILMEIAEMRVREIRKIFTSVLTEIEIRKDLAGKPRVIGGRCFSR